MVAAKADDGAKLIVRVQAGATFLKMRAEHRLLSMIERAVEIVAEQFLALLAVHFTYNLSLAALAEAENRRFDARPLGLLGP
jgi:hypothetical protein